MYLEVRWSPEAAEDLEAIATFLYEANLREPGWYHEHYRQEHGAYPSTSQ